MSKYVENKMTVANTTVRFFFKRSQAISEANLRTKATQQQHSAIIAYPERSHENDPNTYGWLIENVVSKEYFDIDGRVPDVVIEALTKVKR